MIVMDLSRIGELDVRRVEASDLSVDPVKFYPDDEGALRSTLDDAGVDLLIWGKIFSCTEKRARGFFCRRAVSTQLPVRDVAHAA